MDIGELKKQIYLDNKIEHLLSKVGCKNICDKGKYLTCSNPDGDNPTAVQVFKEPTLGVQNYTRDIPRAFNQPDLIDLLRFYRDEIVSKTLKWICDELGYNFYLTKPKKESALKCLLKNIKRQMREIEEEEIVDIEPLENSVLDCFMKCGNKAFTDDKISLKTQEEFEIGIDYLSDRITIPIRDSNGTLVGVKGRILDKSNAEGEQKYIYLFKCPKSQILYGLDKTYQHIMEKKFVYVFESEKSVMQCWSQGIYNCVAIGGHCLSGHQAYLLNSLNVDIILCYDKDVNMNKKNDITGKTYFDKERLKLSKFVKVGYMEDMLNYLDEKDSFSDKLEYLDKFTIKGEIDVK